MYSVFLWTHRLTKASACFTRYSLCVGLQCVSRVHGVGKNQKRFLRVSSVQSAFGRPWQLRSTTEKKLSVLEVNPSTSSLLACLLGKLGGISHCAERGFCVVHVVRVHVLLHGSVIPCHLLLNVWHKNVHGSSDALLKDQSTDFNDFLRRSLNENVDDLIRAEPSQVLNDRVSVTLRDLQPQQMQHRNEWSGNSAPPTM